MSGEGCLTDSGVSYAYFWKGHPKDEKNESDVSLAIHTELTKHLEQLQGISDRIIFPQDKILLLCDFNARVFKVCNTWKALKMHGLGENEY